MYVLTPTSCAVSYGSLKEPSGNREFYPIPELQREQSDIMLLFLSAPDIYFNAQIDDPWFAAHQTHGIQPDFTDHQPTPKRYRKDDLVTVLGCVRQTQYCLAHPRSPEAKHCEEPRGVFGDIGTVDNGRYQNLLKAIDALVTANIAPIETLVNNLGTPVLVAKTRSLRGGVQGALPDNQWQLEVENLVSISLAAIQRGSIDAVKGPPTPESAEIWAAPDSDELRALCKSQVRMY